MNLDKLQLRILIAESANESFKLHVLRMQRAANRAVQDACEARDKLASMEQELAILRDEYLKRTV